VPQAGCGTAARPFFCMRDFAYGNLDVTSWASHINANHAHYRRVGRTPREVHSQILFETSYVTGHMNQLA
jgi:hypothetical protein